MTMPRSANGDSPLKSATLTGKKVENWVLTGTDYTVTFQFNPKTITVSHSVKMTEVGTGENGKFIASPESLGLPSIKVQDTTVDGPDIINDCEQLLWWSYALPPASQPENKPAPPQLTFSWCDFEVQGQKAISVIMQSADITYERFTPQGKPIRATVKLTLQPQVANSPGQQNPTSGGLPGRGGHVLANGETLPGIALDTYGNPASWRTLAEANHVDDPLRVSPGAVLYLPSRAELADGGAP